MSHVWQNGEEWVAADDSALVHAFGATEAEAVQELGRRRDEQLNRLRELGRDRIYPHLQRALDYLEGLEQ